MAKKKQKAPDSAEKQLKAAVKKLQVQLGAAEKSAAKWKSRAKDHQSVAAGAKSELAALRRRAEKAEASVAKWRDRAKGSSRAPAAAPAVAVAAGPDESWTVMALRAEARSRGVVNYSRKSKAQLLVELGG